MPVDDAIENSSEAIDAHLPFSSQMEDQELVGPPASLYSRLLIYTYIYTLYGNHSGEQPTGFSIHKKETYQVRCLGSCESTRGSI